MDDISIATVDSIELLGRYEPKNFRGIGHVDDALENYKRAELVDALYGVDVEATEIDHAALTICELV